MARIRIASFNVENLFERPRAMSGQMREEGNPILDAHARINELFQAGTYTEAIRAQILDLLKTLGLLRSDEAQFAVLRQVRGRLVKRPAAPKPVEVVAGGRGDWIGWVDLVKDRVDELAMTNTARVITDVDADIQAVVEAESRIALKRFADAGVLAGDGKPAYPHVMVIDGNDSRGIDVGLMTKGPHAIVDIVSHVDDADSAGRPVFSRDCPQYTVALASGRRIVLLVNHLKSKGYGTQADNDALRGRQARRVAAIYQQLRAAGQDDVVVLGDLNDTPDSAPLHPLLAGTDLQDVTVHPAFTSDGRPGTYANGAKSQKIDYLLLSPHLFGQVVGGAIFRKGVWGGVNGTLFPHYDTMTSPVHAASDHAALYADLDLDA
ncbi:MAG TPA: endonuclease/exonuclease/phosphatase family protein [Cellulomonas sp.]